MTAVDSGASDSVHSTPEPAADAPAPAAPAPAPVWAGDPMAVGLPSFIAGSVALGLVLVGMVPATAVGASLVGQSAVACVFGIFAGFWLSYAVLVLGLVHGWFGITLLAIKSTQELFLTAWLVIIVMLTLATLRLPVAYTVLFGLIDLALLLVLIGTANASTGTLKVAGYVVLLFAALGVYLFFSTLSQATGGKALPLGKPLMS